MPKPQPKIVAKLGDKHRWTFCAVCHRAVEESPHIVSVYYGAQPVHLKCASPEAVSMARDLARSYLNHFAHQEQKNPAPRKPGRR
jgi:hypothetical protein